MYSKDIFNSHSLEQTWKYTYLDYYKIRYPNSLNYVFASCLNYIIILKKLPDTNTNEDRHVVFPEDSEYKADKLKVILCVNKFTNNKINEIKDNYIKYKINDILISNNINLIYYKNIELAFHKDLLKYNKNYTGIYKEWTDSGIEYYKEIFINGENSKVFHELSLKLSEYSKKLKYI